MHYKKKKEEEEYATDTACSLQSLNLQALALYRNSFQIPNLGLAAMGTQVWISVVASIAKLREGITATHAATPADVGKQHGSKRTTVWLFPRDTHKRIIRPSDTLDLGRQPRSTDQCLAHLLTPLSNLGPPREEKSREEVETRSSIKEISS